MSEGCCPEEEWFCNEFIEEERYDDAYSCKGKGAHSSPAVGVCLWYCLFLDQPYVEVWCGESWRELVDEFKRVGFLALDVSHCPYMEYSLFVCVACECFQFVCASECFELVL